MSESTLSMDFINRFHNMNLAVKDANELAAQKANELVEACMKETQRLHTQLDEVFKELADAKGEIEDQVDIIIKQKDVYPGSELFKQHMKGGVNDKANS